MKDLFNIDASKFKYVRVAEEEYAQLPSSAALLKLDSGIEVGVLISTNVAIANILFGPVNSVCYLPLEVFTVCKDFIKEVYMSVQLADGKRVHDELEKCIWNKAPNCSREELTSVCEGYTPSERVKRLCSSSDRVVYVYADTSTGDRWICFEVVDLSTGNNINSVVLSADVYEAVCNLVNNESQSSH